MTNIKYVLVAFKNTVPIGCGTIKEYDAETMEIKRMYTIPENRGTGIATKVLLELERWAAELGYETCVLETGKRQKAAVELYKKNGYKSIPNYGKYTEMENSICFEKKLNDKASHWAGVNKKLQDLKNEDQYEAEEKFKAANMELFDNITKRISERSRAWTSRA